MANLKVVKGSLTDHTVIAELNYHFDPKSQLYCFDSHELFKLVRGVIKATGVQEISPAVAIGRADETLVFV